MGSSVTFSVAVSGSGGTPTGTVYFKDGSTLLGSSLLSGGTATYSNSSLATGPHSITASYSGDTVFAAITSTGQTITINLATATVTATVPSSSTLGTSVTLSVSVNGTSTTPNGSVIFMDGTTALSTVPLVSGSASYSTSGLTTGPHVITVVYSGDSHFAGATSSPQTLTVSLVVPTITLSVPTTAVVGSSVTFTATLTGTGSTPTGTVTFMDSTTTLASMTLASGSASFSTSSLTVGSHSIIALYNGDTHYAAVPTGPKPLTITQATATIFEVVSSVGITGLPITFGATVSGTPGAPTGGVTFKDGTTVLGTTALASGSASVTISTLTAGSYSITASYSGDNTFAAATTAAQTIQISVPANVSFTLTPANHTITQG